MLVTGSSGRIGRLLRLIWRREGSPEIPVRWIARTSPDAEEIAWDYASPPPDSWPGNAVILHLAGRVSGDEEALAQNVDLALALAGAARSRGAAHVLFASSVAVYRPQPGPIAETVAPDPLSAYGKSKLAAEAALAEALSGSGTGLTCLRIANLAGADALLGGALAKNGPVVLDPVPGQPAGPERSYIGPRSLALTLARLAGLAARDPVASPAALPAVLNLAQPGAVAMGELLSAAKIAWQFGDSPAPSPRVVVDTARLQALAPLSPATPEGLVAELAQLRGAWP